MYLLQAFTPFDGTQLIKAEKSQAILFSMFITEKQDGTITARACADGQKQRGYMPKEEVVAPTVMLEFIFIIAVLEAKERRDVAVMNLLIVFSCHK